ncbi:MAG: FkbM family methyltransferase [Terriglobales bacterium]
MSLKLLGTVGELRQWLGPLGRYRPGLLRKDMAQGFHNCDGRTVPAWARLLRFASPEEKLLEGLEMDGQVVYDVGAFTGAYSLFFSRQVGPSGRVIAFEPQDQSFLVLIANLERNRVRNVLPLHVALGERAGARPIFMLPGMRTTASLAPEAHTPLRRQIGEAQVERLDELMHSVPLPPPGLIKVDVEGLELEVLHGAQRTLEAHRPNLLIEVHGASLQHKAERIQNLCNLLRPLGYSLLHAESGRTLGATVLPDVNGGHIFAHT